jgi:hypothetical protein
MGDRLGVMLKAPHRWRAAVAKAPDGTRPVLACVVCRVVVEEKVVPLYGCAGEGRRWHRWRPRKGREA